MNIHNSFTTKITHKGFRIRYGSSDSKFYWLYNYIVYLYNTSMIQLNGIGGDTQ